MYVFGKHSVGVSVGLVWEASWLNQTWACHITRISKHMTHQSGVAKHFTKTRHSISSDKTEVITNIWIYNSCIIREGTEIKTLIASAVKINRALVQPGFTLPPNLTLGCCHETTTELPLCTPIQ
jgi:NDP-sugar pyrophosphorylase family protein